MHMDWHPDPLPGCDAGGRWTTLSGARFTHVLCGTDPTRWWGSGDGKVSTRVTEETLAGDRMGVVLILGPLDLSFHLGSDIEHWGLLSPSSPHFVNFFLVLAITLIQDTGDDSIRSA